MAGLAARTTAGFDGVWCGDAAPEADAAGDDTRPRVVAATPPLSLTAAVLAAR